MKALITECFFVAKNQRSGRRSVFYARRYGIKRTARKAFIARFTEPAVRQ